MTFAVKSEPNDEEMEILPLQQTGPNLQESPVTLENYTLDYYVNSSAQLAHTEGSHVSVSTERMSWMQGIIEVKQNELELAHERIKYLEEKMKKTSADPGIVQDKKDRPCRSSVWQHFFKEKNAGICRYCHSSFSKVGGSTTNLRRHLQRKHSIIC